MTEDDTYLAYTEYNRETETGTVAFMQVKNVEHYNKAQGDHMSNHMAMYHKLNGHIPTATRDKIFTGTRD